MFVVEQADELAERCEQFEIGATRNKSEVALRTPHGPQRQAGGNVGGTLRIADENLVFPSRAV